MSIRSIWPAVLLLLYMAAAGLCQDTPDAAVQSVPLHRIEVGTPEDLQSLFRYAARPLPVVSAHRGGPDREYPENCIATFEHTLAHTFAMLEIDPRFTKDGAIVVHHDADLKRTTTGEGLVADHTLDELKKLRLKDIDGRVTDFTIPTLDEVFAWARGKTILVLDQKDVPAIDRVKEIEEHKAEAYSMLIVYSFEDAKKCHAQNPRVMMEVMIPSLEKAKEFDRTGVPWRNVVAFVGHTPPEDPALYAAIHERGAMCIVGTSRNLDRRFTSGDATMKQLETDYRSLLKRGADLIETDIPAPLGALLHAASDTPQVQGCRFLVKVTE